MPKHEPKPFKGFGETMTPREEEIFVNATLEGFSFDETWYNSPHGMVQLINHAREKAIARDVVRGSSLAAYNRLAKAIQNLEVDPGKAGRWAHAVKHIAESDAKPTSPRAFLAMYMKSPIPKFPGLHLHAASPWRSIASGFDMLDLLRIILSAEQVQAASKNFLNGRNR